uniref:Uncharacterized protein n=1 Tax=Helianthus annuus TaxID=4232 RepID=A0A251S0W0_HELAN
MFNLKEFERKRIVMMFQSFLYGEKGEEEKRMRRKEEINITFLILFQFYPRKNCGGYISHIPPIINPPSIIYPSIAKLFDHLLSSAISSSSSSKSLWSYSHLMAPLLKWSPFQLLLFPGLAWQLVLDFIIYHDQTTVKLVNSGTQCKSRLLETGGLSS